MAIQHAGTVGVPPERTDHANSIIIGLAGASSLNDAEPGTCLIMLGEARL